MAAPITYTNDEIINLLRARVPDADAFRVKIYRRKGAMGLPENFCTMGDATLNHIVNVETWLPRLCGGGSYSLQIYHEGDTTLPIGGLLHVTVQGQALPEVNVAAVRSSGWNGPGRLVFPEDGPTQTTGTVVTFPSGLPGTPTQTAPQSHVPGGASPGAHYVPTNPAIASNDSAWIRIQEEKFAHREREMLQREASFQQQIAEERNRIREDKLRAEAQAREAAIDAKIERMMEIKKNEATQAPKTDSFKEIAMIFAPIVQTMIQTQNESRSMMLKAQQDQTVQFQQLMVGLMSKKEMSPEMQILLTTLQGLANKPPDDGVGKMMDAMNAISKTSVNMMQIIAEMQLAQSAPEHPGLQAVREVAKALGSMARAPKAQPQPQPQLPAGVAPQQRPMPPQAQQQAQQQRPAPQPQPHPTQTPPQAQPQQAFAGVPQQAQPQQSQQPHADTVTTIVNMIYTFVDTKVVAAHFVEALKNQDPDLVALLEKHDGSIQDAAASLLTQWAEEDPINRMPYLQTLFNDINEQGLAAGILSPDDNGQEIDDTEDDE